MNRFAPMLEKMSRDIDVPQPLKARIMLKMAGDLDNLYAAYRERGMDEDEAMCLAEEKVATGEEAVDLLIRMNDSAVRRFLRKFSSPAQKLIERLLWSAAMIAMIVFLYLKTAHSSLFTGGPFSWLMTAVALTAAGIAISRFYVLYIKKDHTLPGLRKGLSTLIFLACLNMLIGFDGFICTLYSAFDTLATTEGNSTVFLWTASRQAFSSSRSISFLE